MVYIAKDTVERLTPGAILGDTKSIETRRLPIKINPSTGQPVDEWSMGLVVYVDGDGYAKPFISTTTGKIPYGVVAEINIMPANTVVYTNSEAYNTVLVVVSGVIGVAYTDQSTGNQMAKVGDLVNQFGSKYRPGTEAVPTTDVCVGVCDGVAYASDGSTPTPAVRIAVLRVGAAGTGTFSDSPTPPPTPVEPETVDVLAKSNNSDIYPGTPLVIVGTEEISSANGTREYPVVEALNTGVNLRFEGFAVDFIPAGTVGKMQVSGEIELPYFTPDGSSNITEPRVVRLASDPNPLPTWFVQTCRLVAAIGEFCAVAFGTISKGAQMYKAIREYRGSSVGRIVGQRSAENPLGWVIDPKTNKNISDNPEQVITGWVTIDVNPQNDLAPASLEKGFVPDVSSESEPRTKPVIGHIYGGSDAKVEELTSNFTGMPFFGVCISDELDQEGNAVFARDGIVNVHAATAWHAGDYIDCMRNPVPDVYEPYIARIGIAIADCAAGAMGAVQLKPYDPNEYIILDNITIWNYTDEMLNTAVWQDARFLFACTDDDLSNRNSLRGILRGYIPNYSTGDQTGRAIIQTGGYAWVTDISGGQRWHMGCPILEMGPDWIHSIDLADIDLDIPYTQLGIVVSTFQLDDPDTTTLMIKLDIKHHPKLEFPEPVPTGREDVRFNIKKVIPLVKTDDNKMRLANDDDRFFTVEGVDSEVYADTIWRDEFLENITVTANNQSAADLEFGGTKRGIISSFIFLDSTSNKVRFTYTSDIPDQWDYPDYRVLGYQLELRSGLTGNKVIVSTPIYFILNSENTRKPIDEQPKPEEEVTSNA